MNSKTKNLFQILILIGVLLLLGVVFLLASKADKEPAVVQTPEEKKYIDTLKKEELLPVSAQSQPSLSKQQKRALAVQRYLSQRKESPAVHTPQAQEAPVGQETAVPQQPQPVKKQNPLTAPYVASKEDLASIRQQILKDQAEKVRAAQEIYGSAGARKMEAIYKNFLDRYIQLWSNPSTTLQEKQKGVEQLNQDINRQMEQLNKDPKLQEIRLKRQVETSLAQMMQDPSVQQATPAQREALEKKARPVLMEMYQQVNQILESDLPQAEKEKRLEQVQAAAQQKLAE